MSIRRKLLEAVASQSGGERPEGLVAVDSVTLRNGQYIDTEFVPRKPLYIKAEVNFLSTQDNRILCDNATSSSDADKGSIRIMTLGSSSVQVANGAFRQRTTITLGALPIHIAIEVDGNTGTVNGKTLNVGFGTYVGNGSLLIAKSAYTKTTSDMEFMGMQVKQDGELALDLQPSMYQGRECVFDAVSGTVLEILK